MRVGKLDTRFTMILSGKFLDNYTAGLQRYVGANENELYSIPLSYTDGQGKFNLLKDLEIGYNNSIEPLRLKRVGNEPYDVKQFPVGEYDNLEVDLNVKLIDLRTDLLMMKDAREQVSITHTSYLQNETQEIKFYRFMPITNLGFMIRDVELSDDLKLFGIDYEDFNFSYSFEIEEMSVENSYKVKVISDDIDYFELGIVFINEFDGQYTLVGALKNPIINGNVLEFYVSTTRSGIIDFNRNSFRGLLESLITTNVDVGLNINVIDQSEIGINLNATQYEEIDYLLNLNSLLDVSYNVGLNLVIHEYSIIALDYSGRGYQEEDYLLSLNTEEELSVISGQTINEVYNQSIGLDYSYKSNQENVYSLSLNTEEITTRTIGHNISVEEESVIGVGSYSATDPQPVLTWQYNGTSSEPFCEDPGFNMIGTTCSV